MSSGRLCCFHFPVCDVCMHVLGPVFPHLEPGRSRLVSLPSLQPRCAVEGLASPANLSPTACTLANPAHKSRPRADLGGMQGWRSLRSASPALCGLERSQASPGAAGKASTAGREELLMGTCCWQQGHTRHEIHITPRGVGWPPAGRCWGHEAGLGQERFMVWG